LIFTNITILFVLYWKTKSYIYYYGAVAKLTLLALFILFVFR